MKVSNIINQIRHIKLQQRKVDFNQYVEISEKLDTDVFEKLTAIKLDIGKLAYDNKMVVKFKPEKEKPPNIITLVGRVKGEEDGDIATSGLNFSKNPQILLIDKINTRIVSMAEDLKIGVKTLKNAKWNNFVGISPLFRPGTIKTLESIKPMIGSYAKSKGFFVSIMPRYTTVDGMAMDVGKLELQNDIFAVEAKNLKTGAKSTAFPRGIDSSKDKAAFIRGIYEGVERAVNFRKK